MKKTFILFLFSLISIVGFSATITSISPAVSEPGKTIMVTITGANTHFSQGTSTINFSQGSNTITFGNFSTIIISDTSVQTYITIPTNANAGDYDVSISNATDGNISLLNGFHVNAGTNPVIASISPNTAVAGKTLTVTITGTNTHFSQGSSSINFSQGSSTIFSNSNTINAISNTSLQADFTIPANAYAGDYDVSISNGVDGNISLLKGFHVNSGTNPVIASISPNTAVAGKTLTVTITGTNTHFSQGSSSIIFSQGSSTIAANSTTVNAINNTSLQADFTIPVNAYTGDYDVSISNGVDGNITLLKGFHVNSGTNSVIASISPNTAVAGKTLTVTITGTNTHFSQGSSSIYFSQGSSTIAANSNTVNAINNTSLQADFTIPVNAYTGDYDVSISNGVDGNLSLAGGFKITNPVLASISPNVTTRNTTLTVSISGRDTHFSQGSNTINLVQGSNTIVPNTLNVISDTNIQASFTIASNANLGNYNVNLTNPVDGSLSLIDGFKVKDTPSLTSISPGVSEPGKTLTVTITGTNTHFSQATSTVNLNQQSSNTVINPDIITVITDSSIQATFTLPLSTSIGDYNVNVSNNIDEDISILNGFHINQNISSFILSASPGTASPGQTLTVTVTGILTHFSLEDCTLNLTNGNNTIVAASITKNSDTSMQANFVIPQNVVIGYYDVNVSNSTDGTMTLTNGFQIGTPSLVSIFPKSMERIGDTIIVTIIGAFTHFSQAGNTIYLNQGSNIIPANDQSVNVISDTSIQVAFTILSTTVLGPYNINLSNLKDVNLSLRNGVTVVVGITGNENVLLNDLLVVTPNPVKDSFSFNNLNEKGTLTLYDLNNRLLLEKQITGSEKVYVSTLPNGIYIVKLVTDSGTKIQKVIKQ